MAKLCHIRQPKDIDKFLIVVPNFISELEEEAVAQFVQPKLQRKRYEGNHWDSVITKYKETEMSSLNAPETVSRTLDRVSDFIRKVTDSPDMVILPPHILDLSADGFIGERYAVIESLELIDLCLLHKAFFMNSLFRTTIHGIRMLTVV
jgi:hypothetical protein